VGAIRGVSGETKAEVLGEDRTIIVRDGAFSDSFQPWDVHLYRISLMLRFKAGTVPC
jgi:hypothetical protein